MAQGSWPVWRARCEAQQWVFARQQQSNRGHGHRAPPADVLHDIGSAERGREGACEEVLRKAFETQRRFGHEPRERIVLEKLLDDLKGRCAIPFDATRAEGVEQDEGTTRQKLDDRNLRLVEPLSDLPAHRRQATLATVSEQPVLLVVVVDQSRHVGDRLCEPPCRDILRGTVVFLAGAVVADREEGLERGVAWQRQLASEPDGKLLQAVGQTRVAVGHGRDVPQDRPAERPKGVAAFGS